MSAEAKFGFKSEDSKSASRYESPYRKALFICFNKNPFNESVAEMIANLCEHIL